MSCITFLTFRAVAPQVTEAARYEMLNTHRVETTPSPENRPAIRWQVVTDEQGRRRLEMRWKIQ